MSRTTPQVFRRALRLGAVAVPLALAALFAGKTVEYRRKYHAARGQLHAFESRSLPIVPPTVHDDDGDGDVSTFPLLLDDTVALHPPRPDQLHIDPDEDVKYLQSVLDQILADAPDDISHEQIALRLLRFVAASLRNQANSGTATSMLKDGYAICGGMTIVYARLARLAGIPTRRSGLMGAATFGSHAVCECWIDDAWRLVDPTHGVFFASSSDYPRSGHILSLHDLMSGTPWTMFKVVEKPWQGLDNPSGNPPILPVEDSYLIDPYGISLVEAWKAAAADAFPVFYGIHNFISCPVAADLTSVEEIRLGEPDRSDRDMLMLTATAREVGGAALGGKSPCIGHTVLITTAEPAFVEIEYRSCTADFGSLHLLPLAGAHLMTKQRIEDGWRILLRTQNTRAVAMFACPFGETFSVDSIVVRRVQHGSRPAAGKETP